MLAWDVGETFLNKGDISQCINGCTDLLKYKMVVQIFLNEAQKPENNDVTINSGILCTEPHNNF